MNAPRAARALKGIEPVRVEAGRVPDEARRVRVLGCPATRGFEVLELGGMIIVREIATVANPAPGPFAATLPMAQLLNAMAADVLKANDSTDALIDAMLARDIDGTADEVILCPG